MVTTKSLNLAFKYEDYEVLWLLKSRFNHNEHNMGKQIQNTYYWGLFNSYADEI